MFTLKRHLCVARLVDLYHCCFLACAVDARPLHPVLQSVSGWRWGAASLCGSCFLCALVWPRRASSCGQRLRVWAEWLCTLVSKMTLTDNALKHCPIMTDGRNVRGNCPVKSVSSRFINRATENKAGNNSTSGNDSCDICEIGGAIGTKLRSTVFRYPGRWVLRWNRWNRHDLKPQFVYCVKQHYVWGSKLWVVMVKGLSL